MIVVHGLEKRFGRRAVLRGLDASIAGGRVTALVGPNGAGKTTLLKLLLGLARPDRGTIAINGRVLDGTPDYRNTIGYMPQIARFPAHLTGRELLETLRALRPAGLVPDLTLAEALAVTAELDRPLGALSGGTRQKINAALAFAFHPEILILDEPTAGLDPLASRVFKDHVLAARRAGRTVLITSHVIPELQELADDLLFLSEGQARWQGPVRELLARTAHASLERAVAQLLGGAAMLAVA